MSCSGKGEFTSLPQLTTFLEQPSDRFLVDLDTVDSGHPFKGMRATQPHTGAHVQFNNQDNPWPSGTAPRNYPLIYAVADGVVKDVTEYFQVGSVYRYGITLAIAKSGDAVILFEYSIEPMINPNDPNFYKSYIFVEKGQNVKKGDVIASMVVPPGPYIGSHIHFDLRKDGDSTFMVPAIFSPSIVSEFAAHWGSAGIDGSLSIPVCTGYLLSAEQNPFGTGASDCL